MTHEKDYTAFVEHIKTTKDMTVNDLVMQMQHSGVMGAGKIAAATRIAEEMINDKQCAIFFGFAGAMVPGGMKQVIIDMLEAGWINVFVSTGANLTHDMIEALGQHHYQGTHLISDEELNKKGFDRIYDAFMPNEVYGTLEDFFEQNFDKIFNEKMNVKQFLWKLGSLLPKDKPSILRTCYEKKIPIFCPAISDSGIGLMVWGHLAKNKKVDIGAFDDLKDILDLAWGCNKAGIWYVGGGTPKNYIQQAMQFSPKAAEYGIQITMDRPEPGGSSGAELREGISWGKMNANAKFVDVICDATIAMPVIVAALKSRFQ
ncbi:MAG: deoxyhypusine synthase family protein [Nanoarchaeota archaeon]|nr:deoxyhypusine synthase family protein [Nanoarchaeota archaeon]